MKERVLDERMLKAMLGAPIAEWSGVFPATPQPVSIAAIGEQGWNLMSGDLIMPAMILKESALSHNIRLMMDYCDRRGVSLAPHGKTTMAPQLIHRQLKAGAWGVSAATVAQVRAFRRFGVGRVLLANEVVDPAAIRWLASELDSDPEFEFFCLVDSVQGVRILEEEVARGGGKRSLSVLVEIGVSDGRTGCRSNEEAMDVARCVSKARHLSLAGVETYEGVAGRDASPDSLAAVDALLRRAKDLLIELDGIGAFSGRSEVIISAGGSVFFDRVVHLLQGWQAVSRHVRVVLRSGCYVTHDSGRYHRLSPLDGRAESSDSGRLAGISARPGGAKSEDDRRLKPALEAWSTVLSRPQEDLAILGMGKRDVPYDEELPKAQMIRDRGGTTRSAEGEIAVVKLMDQHAFLRVEESSALSVGDLVGCGISHPCGAFDRWRVLPLVNDEYSVVGGVVTFF